MAGDDVFELGGNAGQAVSEVERLIASFVKLDQVMRNLRGGTLELDKDGHTLRSTLRGVTDEGDKVNRTFVTAGGESRVLSTTISVLSKEQRALNEALRTGQQVMQDSIAIMRGAETAASRLAETFEDRLANSLNNIRGVQEQNVRATERSTQSFIAFVDAINKSHAQDLANSLNNLRGVQEQNVRTTERAAAATRALASTNEQAFNERLANSLNNIRGVQEQKTRATESDLKAKQAQIDFEKSVARAVEEATLARIQREIAARRQNREELERETKARRDGANARALSLGSSLGTGTLSFRAGIGNLTREGFSGLGSLGNFGAGVGLGAVATVIDAGVSKLRQTIAQGADDAFEFNKQIGLIRTITKDASSTTEVWSDALRKLSREFNINEIDVAKGAYQALSNQVIKGAGGTKFLSDALRLAKVTNTEFTASVDAVSAVMNSFGARAGSSASIVDKLFTAVDLGNFRLNEIGGSIGRVTSLAAPLGISFSEVLASLETVTIQGVKADESLSALSNLYSELLKPSDALRASFNRLGFSTAQQGIATLTYSGFLKAVIADSKEFGQGIEELFPNIRGLREALLESNDGFERLNENLKKTEESSGNAARGLKEVQAAAGEETQKALNSLKVSAENVWTKFLEFSDSVARSFNERKPLEEAEIERLEKIRNLTPGSKPGSSAATAGETDEERQARFKLQDDLNQKAAARKLLRQVQQANDQFTVAGRLSQELPPRTPEEQPIEVIKVAEDELHRERLKKVFELRKAQTEADEKQLSNIRATTKEFLSNLDKRRAASEEQQTKQQFANKDKAFDAAIGLADPEQAKKLIEERVNELRQLSQEAIRKQSALKGRDFELSKAPEDARRDLDEIVKIKLQQRDAEIKKLRPEDRSQALAAVTEGNFGSLTGLDQPTGDLRKAQDELNQAIQERLQLETQIQKILKDQADATSAASKRVTEFDAAFKEADKFSKTVSLLENAAGLSEPLLASLRAEAARRDNALVTAPSQTKTDDVTAILQLIRGLNLAPGTKDISLALFGAAGITRKTDRERDLDTAQRLGGAGGIIAAVNSVKTVQTVNRLDERWEAVTTSAENLVRSNIVLDGTIKNLTLALRRGVDPKVLNAQAAVENVQNAARSVGAFFGFEEGGVVGETFNAPGPTDVIPAMLARGERVLTVEQNKNFTPLIEAALNGRARGFEAGGQVNHLHGGINVTVMGGNTSQSTIGNIARGLERAYRRGTFRLG